MLGTSTGSEIRRPLGYAIFGDSALSQIMNLVYNANHLSLDRLNVVLNRDGRKS
jgi:hypothetical protein